MLLRCVVPIAPRGKARARVTDHGTYTPAATRQAEKDIRTYWLRDVGCGFGTAAVRLTVTAVFARPKSVKRKHHTVTPDWDNVGKLVSDALNGIAWADDAQVVEGRVIKRYAEAGGQPHIVITVEEVDAAPTPDRGECGHAAVPCRPVG